MLPIRTILHATDFSERSDHAFRVARALARDHGARLVLAHVLPLPLGGYSDLAPLLPQPPEVEHQARQKLAALRPPGPSAGFEDRLRQGDAADEILRLAEETEADLIVLGTHGRTGLGRLLLGSVAEAVLRRARCPVLVLKMPFPAEAGPAETTS
jgi:nucleotide-binding universal stress UspA family protein